MDLNSTDTSTAERRFVGQKIKLMEDGELIQGKRADMEMYYFTNKSFSAGNMNLQMWLFYIIGSHNTACFRSTKLIVSSDFSQDPRHSS